MEINSKDDVTFIREVTDTQQNTFSQFNELNTLYTAKLQENSEEVRQFQQCSCTQILSPYILNYCYQ